MDPVVNSGPLKSTIMSLVASRKSKTGGGDSSGGSFIEPYPQPLLGGRLGLTSEDVARSLRVNSKVIRLKLRRSSFISDWKKQNFVVVSIETETIPSSYVFDVNAAKAFVGTYNNDIGRSYFSFLLNCERVVLEEIPKLIEENRQIRELAAQHIRPRRVTSNGVKMISKPVPHKEKDIFGNERLFIKWERVPLDSLQPAEFREWKIRHRSKTLVGIQNAQEQDINVINFVTESTSKALLEGKTK